MNQPQLPETRVDEVAVARERATKDIEDIKALRESEPFKRYWLRRLNYKRAAIEKSFLRDGPELVSKDRREEMRQVILAYDELLSMMDADDRGAKNLLSSTGR